MDTVTHFLAAADATAAALAEEALVEAWDRPSALSGYTVGGLAGHLSRGVTTVERYLDAAGATAGAQPVSAARYFLLVLGTDDPVDSDLHATIRSRGTEAAAIGAVQLAGVVRESALRLRARLPDEDPQRPLAVLDGVVLPLGEYLRTRLVELVVHLDDLVVSTGVPVALDAEVIAGAAGLLGEVAALRSGGWDAVRSLARRERHPEAVRAL